MRALGAREPAPGAKEFDMSPEALEAFSVGTPKDSGTLPAMLKQGPEAVAYYVSFRTDPERFGIFVRGGGLKALKEEYHRIIWRDLGKYADKPIDDVAERIEYSLALDYLLTHARFHYLVDTIAATRETADGKPRYLPYLEWRGAGAQKTPPPPHNRLEHQGGPADPEEVNKFIQPPVLRADRQRRD